MKRMIADEPIPRAGGTIEPGQPFRCPDHVAARYEREGKARPADAKPGPSQTKPDGPSETKGVEQYHTGRGWYEVPGVDKSLRKDEAIEALKGE
jgi:hypothetical protein